MMSRTSAYFALTAVIAAAVTAGCAPRDETSVRASLQVIDLLGGTDTLYARVTEPRPFTFPADHGPHPEYRTEWWYFTGNLATAEGRRFGYQLTFFRSALRADTLAPADSTSAWRTRDVYMAHFAVSDMAAERLHATERFARAALDLAGASARPWRVWLDDWSLTSSDTDSGRTATAAGAVFPVRLRAADAGFGIDLIVAAGKPLVLQGDAGYSRKGPEPGNASHYYSFTRMPTTGTIRSDGRDYRVTGASWLDREWSTSALAAQLEGWDWFALQLDDDTELMLYRLRRADGTADPFSAGTIIAADGSAQRLAAPDFRLTPTQWWRSPLDDTRYPVAWRVEVPTATLDLQVAAAFPAQELNLAVRYWEGAVVVTGRRGDRAIAGRGYLEMTGWSRATGVPAR